MAHGSRAGARSQSGLQGRILHSLHGLPQIFMPRGWGPAGGISIALLTVGHRATLARRQSW